MAMRFDPMTISRCAACVALAWAALGSPLAQAGATIPSAPGAPNFTLTAAEDYLPTPDGGSVYVWGYGAGPAMQYPGPNLIVNQGQQVQVTLTNTLPQPTSIVFPGQEGVTTSCEATTPQGTRRLLTCEAAPGQTVTYTFTAAKPGTYLYHSGTRPDLQVEMGLVGALIVRPTGYTTGAPKAYAQTGSAYDHEYLALLTEMDVRIHEEVAAGRYANVDTRDYKPVWWFINGRNGVDTVLPDNYQLLPNQPYGAIVRTHPGEKVLLRLVGAGRDPHPFHTHGNNFTLLAKDGRLFESAPGLGPDRAASGFTQDAHPGETYDLLFAWTGKGLGWDIYGNRPGHGSGGNCNPATLEPGEDAADHCKPVPVVLPELQDLAFGPFYSGSPYLGASGQLPPGEGGFNANGGFFFMWHSHSERELINFNIFPGGMMTFLIVEPPGVAIP
ncbi:multicopper oxidase domain-containing protein [Methylomagnum sp.]